MPPTCGGSRYLVVASGDPAESPSAWPAAIEAFRANARARGLRIAVPGAGERVMPARAIANS